MAHPNIRHATLEDVPQIVEYANEFLSHDPISALRVNNSKIANLVESFIIKGPKEHLLLVSFDEEGIVGVLAAFLVSPMFSDDKIAVECLWYLEPEYRTSRRGIDLANAFEYWAKMVGANIVQYGNPTGIGSDLASFYERLGAKPFETVYYKALT
jgi:GNAT superfamily N-acetyltransferase